MERKAKRILIMGLPGSGKTTLSEKLAPKLNGLVGRLNADVVRKNFNDWDFSYEGRKRAAKRIADLSHTEPLKLDYCVTDFICPLPEFRRIFNADFTIWMNTIKEGRFDDTNQLFSPPAEDEYDIVINNFDYDIDSIIKKIDHKLLDDLKNY